MKKKVIILVSIIMLLVGITTAIFISKNSEKYMMKDGIMLVMTLTDEDGIRNITEFPERGTYNIEIDCDNSAEGIWLAEEWKLAVENITGNVKCKIDFITTQLNLKDFVENDDILFDEWGGSRYYGTNPRNWVWFNGEKWRIIGSIPTTLADGTESNLVKIIRSSSIGAVSFDSDLVLWDNSLLYSLLNTKYYGKEDATFSDECQITSLGVYSLCNYEEIGISNSNTDYYGKMIEDVYWNIGTITYDDYLYNIYEEERSTKTSITAKVGVMNLSDAFLSVGAGYTGYNCIFEKCIPGWLNQNGSGWTISYFSDNFDVPSVDSDGSFILKRLSDPHDVRPVVYLDSSVYIISGEGTESNPYQIGM